MKVLKTFGGACCLASLLLTATMMSFITPSHAWCDCRCDNVCDPEEGKNGITCTNFGFPCAKGDLNKKQCESGVPCGVKRVTYHPLFRKKATLDDLCGWNYCLLDGKTTAKDL